MSKKCVEIDLKNKGLKQKWSLLFDKEGEKYIPIVERLLKVAFGNDSFDDKWFKGVTSSLQEAQSYQPSQSKHPSPQ